MEFLDADLALAAGVVVVAGVVRGFSGFGSALLMAPLFALVFTPAQAVGIIMGIEGVASFQLLASVWREAHWREMGPMAAAAWVATPLGAWLLVSVDPDWMRRAVAVIVLVLVLILMSGWRWHGARGLPGALTAGGVSGVLNSLTGTGGPPVILYLLTGPDAAATTRANIIAYYAMLNVGTVAALAHRGVYTADTLGRVAVLLPVFMVTLWVGSRLFGRADDALYRRLALLLLLGVAVFSLIAG